MLVLQLTSRMLWIFQSRVYTGSFWKLRQIPFLKLLFHIIQGTSKMRIIVKLSNIGNNNTFISKFLYHFIPNSNTQVIFVFCSFFENSNSNRPLYEPSIWHGADLTLSLCPDEITHVDGNKILWTFILGVCCNCNNINLSSYKFLISSGIHPVLSLWVSETIHVVGDKILNK